jgi:hypothetical protein
MEEIDSEVFALWVEFNSIDPGEPERSDLRMANILHTIMKSNSSGAVPKPPELLFSFWKQYDERENPKTVSDRILEVFGPTLIFTKKE